jgi:hypothetical protein
MLGNGMDGGVFIKEGQRISVKELKEELKQRGLNIGGNKADLLARLEEYE